MLHALLFYDVLYSKKSLCRNPPGALKRARGGGNVTERAQCFEVIHCHCPRLPGRAAVLVRGSPPCRPCGSRPPPGSTVLWGAPHQCGLN